MNSHETLLCLQTFLTLANLVKVRAYFGDSYPMTILSYVTSPESITNDVSLTAYASCIHDVKKYAIENFD